MAAFGETVAWPDQGELAGAPQLALADADFAEDEDPAVDEVEDEGWESWLNDLLGERALALKVCGAVAPVLARCA